MLHNFLGSVLSPTAQTLSASKPPIFPTPERVGSGLGSGGALSASTTGSFKFSLRRNGFFYYADVLPYFIPYLLNYFTINVMLMC